MNPDRANWWGPLAVIATYTYFLLFAEFGFLHRAESALPDVRPVMAAMGLAGLAGSFITAVLLKRIPLLRTGFAGCAASAALSLASRDAIFLCAVSSLIGFFAAVLTVSLAANLRAIVGGARPGLRVGAATGVAYFLCNVPALFEGAPVVQALVPATLCFVCSLLPFAQTHDSNAARACSSVGRIAGFVAIFFALVCLDSAAFAVIQQTRDLKDMTWQTPAQKLIMGALHFAAAAGAGLFVDRGMLRGLTWAAFGLFAVALPTVNGPLYAVGISLYSVALVAFPSFMAGSGLGTARWRAALVFGVAGWLGSAVGVGLARHVDHIPWQSLLVAGFIVAGGSWLARRASVPLAVAILLLMISSPAQAENLSDQIERGRRVYIQEGCINCHSQFIRPGTRDAEMWGPFRPVNFSEQPPLIGNRRQGPDLMNVGNRRHPLWQELHLVSPRAVSPGSKMPAYDYLFKDKRGDDLVVYLSSLGVTTLVERARFIATWELPDVASSSARGRKLFDMSCANCHGPDGSGHGPLSEMLNDPQVSLRDGPFRFAVGPDRRQALARVVKFGLPGFSMPGHEYFSNEEISDIVAYLQTLETPDGQ